MRADQLLKLYGVLQCMVGYLKDKEHMEEEWVDICDSLQAV